MGTAADYTVNGVDISKWNANPNLAGMEFVGVKATEGLVTDAKWADHRDYVLSKGRVLIAYSFNNDSVNPVTAANYFLRVVGKSTRLVALDLEGRNEYSNAQAAQFIAVCKAAGKLTGVYHSESGFPQHLGQDFNWVANWRTNEPDIPWTFWQNRGSPLDLDVFNGDIGHLNQLAYPHSSDKFLVTIKRKTPIYINPGGAVAGFVSLATYTTQRLKVNGNWWYKIVPPRTGSHANRYIPAEPWLITKPI